MNSVLEVIFLSVINFATWLIFIRFLLQFSEVDKNHPYAKVMYSLTAVVDVFSRIFKPLAKGKLSVAAVVLLILLMLIKFSGLSSLHGDNLTAVQLFFQATVLGIVSFLNALKWVILIAIVCSFIVLFSQRIHPLVEIIMQLADPLITPFRKITPNLGMIDLAPLIAMLVYGFLATAVTLLANDLLVRVS